MSTPKKPTTSRNALLNMQAAIARTRESATTAPAPLPASDVEIVASVAAPPKAPATPVPPVPVIPLVSPPPVTPAPTARPVAAPVAVPQARLSVEPDWAVLDAIAKRISEACISEHYPDRRAGNMKGAELVNFCVSMAEEHIAAMSPAQIVAAVQRMNEVKAQRFRARKMQTLLAQLRSFEDLPP